MEIKTGLFADPLYDGEAAVKDFRELDLYQTWQKHLRDGNDMIIAIAASSKTEMSGTGKTTLGIQLSRMLDESGTPFDASQQATLSSEDVANDLYPDLPPRSAILFDEAQGTAQSDGLDNRRAMADAVVKMSRAAATYRWKQHPLVIITQSTRWIDSRMMDIIDRLILIQETDQQREFGRAVVFDHYFDDLASDKQEYTPALEDIYWRPLPKDDDDYTALHEMKEKAGNPDGGGDNTPDWEAKYWEQQALFAGWLKQELDIPWRSVGDIEHQGVQPLEHSGEYYRREYKDKFAGGDDDE